MNVADLVKQIDALPHDWHGVGCVGGKVLQAIAHHAERIGGVRNSAETGSGKTTLLFSHLSANHLVFAIDEGKSISQVRSSPLFAPQNVTFIEGFTQETVPAYRFQERLQVALIDGPHGYPFPTSSISIFILKSSPGDSCWLTTSRSPRFAGCLISFELTTCTGFWKWWTTTWPFLSARRRLISFLQAKAGASRATTGSTTANSAIRVPPGACLEHINVLRASFRTVSRRLSHGALRQEFGKRSKGESRG